MGGIIYIAIALAIIIVTMIIYFMIRLFTRYPSKKKLHSELKSIKEVTNESDRRENYQTAFFQRKRHTSQVVDFYGESKELDVNYYSSEKIQCDQEELNRFIDQILNNQYESFFALENNTGNIIEVSNAGNSDLFDIVYMEKQTDMRFIGEIRGFKELKTLIDAYFKDEEITKKFKLSAE